MLITNAEIDAERTVDVRIVHGTIAAIGALAPNPGEPALEAGGGALLPGLNDHHLHLMSFAASLQSVQCGPPAVTNEATLVSALRARRPADGWIRGFAYHESVAGDLDRDRLDRYVPDVPVRIQHRSGRLWILNSAALERLAAASTDHGSLPSDGRLYDFDATLRVLVGASLPPLRAASERLAAYGVTGFSDMTHTNTNDALRLFGALTRDGTVRQRVRLAGTLELDRSLESERLRVGATKVHLHETSLPSFDHLCSLIGASHAVPRAVAIHCVTETELVFAVEAFRTAGPRAGDRIEHASVTAAPLLESLRELGLLVVTQPNFVAERGDAYLADLSVDIHADLYRCRSFLDHGIPLAGGTDAPFGGADPWRAMSAAVSRRTASGASLGPDERLTPEQALALFTGSLESPARPRRLAIGDDADLCLLDRPWSQARAQLSSDCVRATLVAGESIFDRVDQSPR
jgi:predicted amidohydrolase YtcJ